MLLNSLYHHVFVYVCFWKQQVVISVWGSSIRGPSLRDAANWWQCLTKQRNETNDETNRKQVALVAVLDDSIVIGATQVGVVDDRAGRADCLVGLRQICEQRFERQLQTSAVRAKSARSGSLTCPCRCSVTCSRHTVVIYIYIYIYIYTHMHVHTYVYTYVYIYI